MRKWSARRDVLLHRRHRAACAVLVRIARAPAADQSDPPVSVALAVMERWIAGELGIAMLQRELSAQRIYQDLVAERGFTASYESEERFVRKL